MTGSRLVKLFALCYVALREDALVSSFSIPPPPTKAACQSSSRACSSMENKQNPVEILNFGKLVASAVFVATVAVGGPVYADEYGIEKEAPTLSTGETVEICTKRGPLGACLKTELRTEENDNDKAKKYFRDPAELIKEKEAVLRGDTSEEGNALINKLKQQTADNKEKNDLYVQRKTFENDQSATFGPLSRQVVIMNTDGRTFTLLESPQAMRLKKAGFIEGREFVKQPTQEDLDAALEAEGPGLAGAILGIFGKGDE